MPSLLSSPSSPPSLDAPIPVRDLSAIEAVLAGMWRAAGESAKDADGGGKPVVRLCLGNIVAVTDRARAHRIAEALDRLSVRRPSRALVACIDDDAPGPEITASIRAVCHLPTPGAPQVCCEQIAIDLGRAGAAHLPGIVMPLLEPDIPSLLWWDRGVAGHEEIFDRLAKAIGAALIDLEQFESYSLARRMRASVGGALRDLAWARIEPWRRAVACVYDDSAMLPELRRVRSLEVRVDRADCAHGKPPAKGLLMIGWLAAQLGWRVASPLAGEGRRWTAAAEGPAGRVEISLERGECAGDGVRTGHLASVVLKSADGCEARLERSAKAGLIGVAVEGPHCCPLRRGASEAAPPAERLLGCALESSARPDRVYLRALDKALEFAQA